MQIDFTPSEQERIVAAARQIGLRPEEFLKRTALQHLPSLPATESERLEETLDAKLRQWQQQDGTALMPDVPTQALFAEWAEEDAHMTDQERDDEARLWEDIERGLAEYGRVRLRHLGQ